MSKLFVRDRGTFETIFQNWAGNADRPAFAAICMKGVAEMPQPARVCAAPAANTRATLRCFQLGALLSWRGAPAGVCQAGPVASGGPSGRPHSAHEPS